MADVFISYAHRDQAEADAICDALIEKGISVWIASRDVRAGESFVLRILEGLKAARVMVLLLTAAAEASRFVLRELESALNTNISIVPFQIEDLPPLGALRFFLGPIHRYNAINGPRADHRLRLVERVEQLLASGGEQAGIGPLLSSPRDDNTALADWLTVLPPDGPLASDGADRDPFRGDTTWKGIIRQDDRIFLATLEVTDRDHDKLKGRLEFTVGDNEGPRQLSFAGRILDGTYVAFITNKLRGRVTYPGLYFGKVEGRTFSGTWQVPGWGQYDAFSLERLH